MAAMHKATCTRPGCGLACSSASVDEVMAWSEAHDQHCPSLKAQEVAPTLIADAEKRGAVKALRALAEEREGVAESWGSGRVADESRGAAAWARNYATRIESGAVTL